jgi:hypothetical protein
MKLKFWHRNTDPAASVIALCSCGCIECRNAHHSDCPLYCRATVNADLPPWEKHR